MKTAILDILAIFHPYEPFVAVVFVFLFLIVVLQVYLSVSNWYDDRRLRRITRVQTNRKADHE